MGLVLSVLWEQSCGAQYIGVRLTRTEFVAGSLRETGPSVALESVSWRRAPASAITRRGLRRTEFRMGGESAFRCKGVSRPILNSVRLSRSGEKLQNS